MHFNFHFSIDLLTESKFTQGLDFVLILRLHLPVDKIHYKVIRLCRRQLPLEHIV